MEEEIVKIELSYSDALALQRVIIEALSSPNLMDKDIHGSPFIARIVNELTDSIFNIDRKLGRTERVRKLEEWRNLTPDRDFWSISISRIDSIDPWKCWSHQEKSNFAKILLSPFRASEDLIDRFIAEVDNKFEKIR